MTEMATIQGLTDGASNSAESGRLGGDTGEASAVVRDGASSIVAMAANLARSSGENDETGYGCAGGSVGVADHTGIAGEHLRAVRQKSKCLEREVLEPICL